MPLCMRAGLGAAEDPWPTEHNYGESLECHSGCLHGLFTCGALQVPQGG